MRERQGLGHRNHARGDANLVSELAELARARCALQHDRLTHGSKQRRGEIIILLGPADHDGERAFTGTAITTGDRGVERAEALGCSLGGQRASECRARSGHINELCAH